LVPTIPAHQQTAVVATTTVLARVPATREPRARRAERVERERRDPQRTQDDAIVAGSATKSPSRNQEKRRGSDACHTASG